MKQLSILAALVVVAFASCQKQQTDEERRAEVERQVQERLASEHQADTQQQLDQRDADLQARERELAARQSATPVPASTAVPETSVREDRSDSSASDTGGSYNTFYTKLDSYGAWMETADYGYVWQPQAAERSRSWRPYTNGRWVYTDAGWTWASEEPFGWATYHYGRWTRLRSVGWVWVPGDEWAPAWVSWRKGNDYVGWAPLPPEARFERGTGIHNWADNYYDIGPEQYTFVPTNDFGDRQLEPRVVSPDRNVTIISHTTNVTNITYSNTTIINHGPDFDALRGHTAQPIERLRLERRTSFDMQNPRTVVRGEAIQMPAPVIGRSRGQDRPSRVRKNLHQTTVERGWGQAGAATEQLRAKMKAEATPPPHAPSRTFVRPTTAAKPAPAAPARQRPVATAAPTPAASATPVRNFPQRGKFTPRPTAPVKPTATAKPTAPVKPAATPARPTARPATPAPKATATPKATPTIKPVESALDAHRSARKQRKAARQAAKQSAKKAAPPTATPISPAPSASAAATAAATATASPSTVSEQAKDQKGKRGNKERKKERGKGRKGAEEASTPAP